MKQQLTNYIIDHIYSQLGLTDNVPTSLIQDIFLIPSVVRYDTQNEISFVGCWGAHVTIENSKISLLAAQFRDHSSADTEWYLLIKVGDLPTHGCYLIVDSSGELFNGVIGFRPNNKFWIPAPLSVQTSVLSGMELLADVTAPWNEITNYKKLIEEMESFIDYTTYVFEIME